VVSTDDEVDQPVLARAPSDDGLHTAVLEQDHQALLKSGGIAFACAVELLVSIHTVITHKILINPTLSLFNKNFPSSLSSSTSFDIRKEIGSVEFRSEIVEAASNIISQQKLWVNSVLESKLGSQLKPVAMVTGAVPKWIRRLPRLAPFLFTKKLRERMMKFMAFGVSRGIVSLQVRIYQ
jgi:hypothetical protein